MGRTLENQALDPDKGLLLIFPLMNLLQVSSEATRKRGEIARGRERKRSKSIARY